LIVWIVVIHAQYVRRCESGGPSKTDGRQGRRISKKEGAIRALLAYQFVRLT